MRNLNLSKRFTLAILAIISTAGTVFAQQEIMYSQYMFNTLALNPAYAGSRDVLSLTAVGRYQWINSIDGAPKTHSFSLDMPIKNEKMGIGIIAYNDAIGVSNNTGINLAYSYRFKIGSRTTMALGLQPTITNVSLKLSQVNTLIDATDPIFNGKDNNKMLFNAGLGLYMSNDKGYLGFSVPQIIEQKYITASDKNKEGVGTDRHYFLTMGMVFGKGNVKIKPSLLTRYVNGSPLGIDGNINVWFRDKISFGVSGRKSQPGFIKGEEFDAAVGMVEIQLTPQLRLGYAYDYNQNKLNLGSDTFKKFIGTPTHEWLLRYEFGYGKSKILTPRYF